MTSGVKKGKKSKTVKKVTRKVSGPKGKKVITVETRGRKKQSQSLGTVIQRNEFAHYFLIYKDAKKAAIKAGYSSSTTSNASTASRLYKDKGVRKEIQRLMNNRASRLALTGDNVLQDIRDEVEKCKEENDHNGVYRGSELIGKHLRLFEETKTVKHVGDPDKPIVSKWEIVITHSNIKEVEGKVVSTIDAKADDT